MELKRYRLGDIAEIYNGATPSTADSTNYDGDIIWATPKDLSEQQSKWFYKGDRNITKKGLDSCSAKMIPANNILMSSRAPIGLCSINKVDCCTNQGFKSIVLDKSIADVDFMYYFLKYHIKEIEALGSGTTFKEISKTSFEKYEINIPNLTTQKKIASILSCFDEKIALNRVLNQNLEAMAKQLYDYWFVQFDFPDEKGKPYKSSGGKMVWNETLKREIPEGWNTAKLENSFQVVSDKAKKENIQHLLYAPIEVLPIKQMSFHNTAPIENAVSGLCKFEKGNILLSNRRVYFHKVCIAPFDGVTRDTVIVLKAINESTFGFDYQIINSEHFISYATKFSYGSEQPVFSWQDAKNYYYAKPNNETAKKYSNCVAPLINKVLEVQNELRELTKQRDELLPLLMNGQVSVS